MQHARPETDSAFQQATHRYVHLIVQTRNIVKMQASHYTFPNLVYFQFLDCFKFTYQYETP
jgi:hypothetical protein